MDNPLSILLIEDDLTECQEMIRYIESQNDVQLVGVTNNIIKAIEYTADAMPDAIILDLELHNGHGNGLAFLDLLREKRSYVPIYVLVTTHNMSCVTHEGARKMGADFIMLKSQEDFSPKTVIDFLRSLKNIIQSNKRVAATSIDTDTPEQQRQRITNRIIAELNRIGIAPNATGRKYLIDSIMLIIDGQVKKIYQHIASKYKKTDASVERAMQGAIEKVWKTSSIDDLEQCYTAKIHSAKGVPTIMEFIYYYAEKIKNEYRG